MAATLRGRQQDTRRRTAARQARHGGPHEKEAVRRARIAIKPARKSGTAGIERVAPRRRAKPASAEANPANDRRRLGSADTPRVRLAESMLIFDKRSHCAA
jgi:hypothetical protein